MTVKTHPGKTLEGRPGKVENGTAPAVLGVNLEGPRCPFEAPLSAQSRVSWIMGSNEDQECARRSLGGPGPGFPED